jgi:penicillin-binding protein 1C
VLLAAAMVALDRWVAATDLPPLEVETSVEVLARDGRLLRAFTVGDGRWRLAVGPARVDPGYLAMLLAYEDHRFYGHRGVDPWALARAGFLSVRYGRRVAGGSTLTMQVARLLEDGATGTWGGKVRQMRVALALERVRTKDEILALYLQLAPMGGNIEGVRAGSIA